MLTVSLMLVVPLLRTLYFASSSRTFISPEGGTRSTRGGYYHDRHRHQQQHQVDPSQQQQPLRPSQLTHSTSTASSASRTSVCSTTSTNSANNDNNSNAVAPHDIRTSPFRSQSQLYVIIILLLIFSQENTLFFR